MPKQKRALDIQVGEIIGFGWQWEGQQTEGLLEVRKVYDYKSWNATHSLSVPFDALVFAAVEPIGYGGPEIHRIEQETCYLDVFDIEETELDPPPPIKLVDRTPLSEMKRECRRLIKELKAHGIDLSEIIGGEA